MYVGHLGIALGAKGARRTVPLWVLVLATQACDWGDALLMALSRHGTTEMALEMWTHSVPAVLVLAAVFGGVYWMVRRRAGEAALVAAVVISHVLVDYLTGVKPTWPGGPVIGLQLYAHPLWDLALESGVIVLGWVAYLRSVPSGRASWRPAWVMLAGLLVLQVLADGVIEYHADGGPPVVARAGVSVEAGRPAG